MSQGICFYIDYEKHCPLLAVAIHSLTARFEGNIHVVFGENTPDFFIEELISNKRISTSSSNLKLHIENFEDNKNKICWTTKIALHKNLPYDVNLLYDCDVLFLKFFDKQAFEITSNYGLSAFCVNNDGKIHNRNQKREIIIGSLLSKEFEKIPYGFINRRYLTTVNAGLVGSTRNKLYLIEEWEANVKKIALLLNEKKDWTFDEHGLSLTMLLNDIPLSNFKWNYTYKVTKPIPETTIAVHYTNQSFYRSRIYNLAFLAAYASDYMGLKTKMSMYGNCNTLWKKVLNRNNL